MMRFRLRAWRFSVRSVVQSLASNLNIVDISCPRGSNTMPEPLQGDSLEASLTVKHLEQSISWYTGVLGFAVERKHERAGKLIAATLCAGAVRILLTQDDGAKGLDRAKGEGLSLQITTPQSVDAVAAEIGRHGGVLDTEPTTMPWGVRIIRFRDPDGFRFTLSSPRAA